MVEVEDRVVAVLAAGKAALLPDSGVVPKRLFPGHGTIRRAIFGEHAFGKVFAKGLAPMLIHYFRHVLAGEGIFAAAHLSLLKELERLRVEGVEELLKVLLHVAAVVLPAAVKVMSLTPSLPHAVTLVR